jgi:hypothetical protein
MHIQILTNKTLKTQQIDNGNLKRVPIYFYKKQYI